MFIPLCEQTAVVESIHTLLVIDYWVASSLGQFQLVLPGMLFCMPLGSCMYAFHLEKYLEVELLGQRIYTWVALVGTAK